MIGARLVILTAMAAMLVASLAVPDAFGEYGVLFGLAYFVVRLLHVVLYVLATGSTPEARQAMLRLAPGFLGAPVLLIPAGFLDGFTQGALWAAALAIDLSVSLVRCVSGFRVHAEHFVERYGLIVIIALGESIVAIGVGTSGLVIGAGVVVAAVLGIALAAALWWAYFDLVRLVAERRLSAAKGEAGARRLQLPASADGSWHRPGRSGYQEDFGRRRGSTWDYPGCSAVRRRRPLPSRTQCLQAARRRQHKRCQVGSDDPLLRAHPRGGVDPFPNYPRHPRGATLRAGRLRDNAITRVPARAPRALEAAKTETSRASNMSRDPDVLSVGVADDDTVQCFNARILRKSMT